MVFSQEIKDIYGKNSSAQEQIKENYQQNLDPHEFKEFKLEGLKQVKWQENYDFWFSCLSEFFSSGDFRGNRLLDVGSGPTVHNVAVASYHIPNIILSDFVKTNCEQLRSWLRKDPDCMDWFPFLSRVARIENHEDVHEACRKMEEQIRSSVKDVIHCDILNKDVIAEKHRKEPFDLILSSLTLETAALDYCTYIICLKNIKNLLKNGGKLILMSLTECSGWYVNDKKFNFLHLTKTLIVQALEINGFKDIKWKQREQTDDSSSSHRYCDAVYFVTCTNR